MLMRIFITKTFFQQLNALSSYKPHLSSTYPPSSSFQTFQDQQSAYPSSTENPNLSSTNSIQEHLFTSTKSSTLTEDPEANILGSDGTFSSLPTEEPIVTNYVDIFLHICFLIFVLIVVIYVIIQCFHFVVYIYKDAQKRIMQERRLPLNIR